MSSTVGRYVAVRALVGGAVAVLLALPAARASNVLPPALLVALAGSTGFAALAGRLMPERGRAVLLGLMAFDLAAETVLVGSTGFARSPFVLLFSLTIASAGIFYGIGVGILFATAATAGYWGWVLQAGAGTGVGVGLTSLCLLLLGVLSGVLGRRIAEERLEIIRIRGELARAQLDAETIVASLTIPLICLDREGWVRKTNRPALELLGLAEQIEGVHPSEGWSAERAAAVWGIVAEIFEAGEGRCAEILLPGVPPTPVEIVASPVRDESGELCGLVLLLTDLTRRKEAEAEQARRERLAVVGELSGHLAHEIRNSLKPVVGSIELLRGEIPPSGVAGELMGIILRESESLEGFLNDFLTFTRDKTLTLVDFDLDELIREEVAAVSRHPARGPRVRIEARPGPAEGILQSDRMAIRDILRNLVLNALEATPEGTVSIAWERVDGRVELVVEDTGAGLPDGPPEALFEPFCTHKAGGTGLGLSIARRLARRLGGEVSLERRSPRGARARLVLNGCGSLEQAA